MPIPMPETNMLMDARVLPDGTTVGRNDPRYYDLESRDPNDDWQRRVRASLAGLRAGGYGGTLGTPSTTNFALRPNVAAVRNALTVGSAAAAGSANPAARGTGLPPMGGGRVPGGDITGNPLMPAPGSPSGPGTNPAARPAGPTPLTGNPTGNPTVPDAPPAPVPTSGGQAPGYGTATNPAWQTFMGGGPNGSANPNAGAILDQRASDYTAANGPATWTPGEKSFFHPGGMKNGGRVRKYGMKRPPITIHQHHGPDLSQSDGEDLSLADGGRVPYTEYVRRNKHPDSFYRDAGEAPPADGGLPFTQAQWDALPLAQQYGNLGGDGAIVSAAGHEIAVNGTQGADGWVTVYGRPQLYGHPDSQWLDPSGLRDNGDGTFSFNPEKINGTRLAHFQQVDSDTGLGDGTHFAIAGIGTVVGGGLLAGAMGAGTAAEGAAGGAFEGATAGAEAGGNVFEGAAAGGEASGGAGLGTDVGLGSESFGGAAGEGFGGAELTPEVVAQNPAVQNAFEGAVASGEVSSGTSLTQWLANPQNLASAGRFIAGLAGAAGSHGSSSEVPLINNPTVTTPGGGAPGAGNPANDPLSYLAGLDPTANWRASGGGDYVRRLQAEADQAGTPAAQEAAAGRAEADVAQRMSRAREARNARLISQGINPYAANGPGAELERQSRLDEARAGPGAENAARLAEENKGWTRRAAAAGLGLTNSGQALQADALGNNLATTRAGFADRGAQRTWQGGENAADRDVRVQQINAGIRLNNNATSRQAARDRGTGTAAIIDAGSRLPWSSIWDSLTGMKNGGRVRMRGLNCAEGGKIDGPGTGTSDSIPAHLSDGEFVINSEATQLLDKIAPGFLEKANERGLKIRNIRSRGLGSNP